MKATYNKSKIMKEANRLMKYEGLTRSQALTLAWSKAKRDDMNIYKLYPKVEAKRGSIMFDMNLLADSLTNYYRYSTFNGD